MIDYNKIIYVDMDDTIEDLLGSWLNYLNLKHDLDVKREDIKEWDMSKAFPTLTKTQINEPLTLEIFWSTIVKPFPDAIKYTKQLIDDGFELYVVTSTDYRNVRNKVEYILKPYFPFIDDHHFITTRKKQLLKGFVMVDDYVGNLIGGDYHKITFEEPYNSQFDISDDIYVAKDWEDVYNKITSLKENSI